MDEAFRKRWLDAAMKVWLTVVQRSGEMAEGDLHGARSSFGQMFAATVKHLPRDFREWTPSIQSLVMDRAMGNVARPPVERMVAFAKCFRLGYAAATDDPRWLQPEEVPLLAGLGYPVVPPRAPQPSVPPKGPAFEVEFAYRFAAIKPGSRSARHFVKATSATTVDRLDARKAPVAWRLPLAAGGAVEVRAHEGALYREVLLPGGAKADEASFVAACAGTRSWQDDPFAEREAASPVAPCEFARDAGPLRAYDFEARDRTLNGCLTRAGRIVSVDGRVFRRTTAPTVHPVVVGTRRKDNRVELAWRVEGLTSHDGHGPLRTMASSAKVSWDCACRGDMVAAPWETLAFPAAMAGAAWDLVQAVADATGVAVGARLAPAAEGDAPHDVVGEMARAVVRMPWLGDVDGMSRVADQARRVRLGIPVDLDELRAALEGVPDPQVGEYGLRFYDYRDAVSKAVGAGLLAALGGAYDRDEEDEAGLAWTP